MHILFAIIALGVGAAVFWYGFNRMHRYRMIQDIPTSKIRSIAMGIVEITGEARGQEFIKARFSGMDCVYYKFEVREYRAHRSGKSTTYRWDRIDHGEQRVAFSVADDTGEVALDPTKAEVNVKLRKLFLRKAGLLGGLGSIFRIFGSGSSSSPDELVELDPAGRGGFFTMNSVGDRKYYEYFIAPGERVYVLGTAAEGPRPAVALAGPGHVICKGDDDFIISDRSEAELIGDMQWKMIGSFAFGVLMIVAGIVVLLHVL